jgi:formylglycine-generating enzyme required for sulfatase activity
MVSWYDAVMFCNWLSERHQLDPVYKIEVDPAETGKYKVTPIRDNGFRLPTEAEWEYACRAMTTTAYCFGEDEATLQQYGAFELNSGRMTVSVGSFKCNAWGLFDVHGNVFEWCGDEKGSRRVHRGGGWAFRARNCRPSARSEDYPTARNAYLGFRVAETETGSR